MFVQGSHTCTFAMIYTSIETSSNACLGKPYLLNCYIGSPLYGVTYKIEVAMLQLFNGLISGKLFFLLSVLACLKKIMYQQNILGDVHMELLNTSFTSTSAC